MIQSEKPQFDGSRYERLSWARARAMSKLKQDDLGGVVTSMLADVGKAREPLFADDALSERATQGQALAVAGDRAGLRRWIETFK